MQKEHAIITADVKCYYCGHISGQIAGYRHEPVTPANFIPRPGYAGAPPVAGKRLRCERCGGPVFLEEVHTDDTTKLPDAVLKQQRDAA